MNYRRAYARILANNFFFFFAELAIKGMTKIFDFWDNAVAGIDGEKLTNYRDDIQTTKKCDDDFRWE